MRDNKFFKASSWLWRNSFARLGEDWVFLALLGIIMALLSYVMDKGISMCTNSRFFVLPDVLLRRVTFTHSFQHEYGCIEI